MLPTIEERAQQHKGTPTQCAYFSRRRHAGIVWAECDSRRRARRTYRMLSSHALIAFSLRVSACLHRTSSRGRYKGAESRSQNSVQKACRMWHARPVPERSGRITPNLACKTPGHKVCDLGFPFRIPFRKRVNATFEAHCEQKRERSYNPKRFSSSSLMIFNAFTRA